MRPPTVTCSSCGKSRDCNLHKRAEFPPDAAKKFLRKNCKTKDQCNLQYSAGLAFFPVVEGQNT